MLLTQAPRVFHKGHAQHQEMRKVNVCIKPDSYGLILAPVPIPPVKLIPGVSHSPRQKRKG